MIPGGGSKIPCGTGSSQKCSVLFFKEQAGAGEIFHRLSRRHGGWVDVDNGCMKTAKLRSFLVYLPGVFLPWRQGRFDCHLPSGQPGV